MVWCVRVDVRGKHRVDEDWLLQAVRACLLACFPSFYAPPCSDTETQQLTSTMGNDMGPLTGGEDEARGASKGGSEGAGSHHRGDTWGFLVEERGKEAEGGEEEEEDMHFDGLHGHKRGCFGGLFLVWWLHLVKFSVWGDSFVGLCLCV